MHGEGNTHREPGEALAALWEITLLLGEDMARGLAERGLTRARAELLTALAHSDPSTQRELATVLRVTPRNVTGLVDGLEADGYLTRGPHPTDRRATLVTLTDLGRREIDTMLSEAHTLAGQLFTDLSARQLAEFTRLLQRVRDRCRDLVAAPPDARGRA